MGQTVFNMSVGTIMGNREYGAAVLVNTCNPEDGRLPVKRTFDRSGYPTCGDGPYWSLTQRPHAVVMTNPCQPTNYGTWNSDYGGYRFSTASCTPEHYMFITYRSDIGVTQGTINYLTCERVKNTVVILNHFHVYSINNREDKTSEVAQALLSHSGTHRVVGRYVVMRDGKVLPQFKANFTEVIEWVYDPYTGPLSNNLFSMTEVGVTGKEVASMLQAAYINAMNDVPRITANMVANVFDAVDAVYTAYKAIKKPLTALRSLLKNSADPRKDWLKYRYQYNTTKADLEEIKACLQRVRELKTMVSDEITVSSVQSFGSLTVKCCASLKITDILPDIPADYGLNLDLYNAWDMVPYSFVVDWVLPVGDILEELRKFSSAMEMQPTKVWYVLHDETESNHAYMRYSGGKLDVLPVYTNRSVSDKTIIYRCADAVSLFTH